MSLVRQKVRDFFENDPKSPANSKPSRSLIQSFAYVRAQDFTAFHPKNAERLKLSSNISSSRAAPSQLAFKQRPRVPVPAFLNLSSRTCRLNLSDSCTPRTPFNLLKISKAVPIKFEYLRNAYERPQCTNFDANPKTSAKTTNENRLKIFLRETHKDKLRDQIRARNARNSHLGKSDEKKSESDGGSTSTRSQRKAKLVPKNVPQFQIDQSLAKHRLKTQNLTSCRNQSPPGESNKYQQEKPRHYEVISQIGKGSYAVVHMARYFASRSLRAIKVYSKSKMDTEIRRSMIRNEISVLQSVSHSNIVKLFRVIENESQVQLVMELVQGISMASWSKAFSTPSVPEEIARPILKSILRALNYLHAKKICHRDLKMENIILTSGFVPKLLDFGFACRSPDNAPLNSFCGTHIYMAPELVNQIPYSGTAVDCWAFGVLVYRVLAGSFPFSASDPVELNQQICSGKYEVPPQLSKEAKQAIGALLVVNPDRRASTRQLQFFKLFR